MKRYLFIIALVLCSCSKEEDSITLKGTYLISEIQGETIGSCDANEKVTFEGGKLILTLAYYQNGACQTGNLTFNYSVNGNTIKMPKENSLFEYSGTILNDNQIRITTKDGSYIESVITYTK